jgi:hypothetical protein
MLFTEKQQQRVTLLELEIKQLSSKYNTLQTQVDALLKLSYAKYGIKRDGTPKAKPGRRNKVVA